MNILAFDTTLERCSIALYSDEKIIFYKRLVERNMQAESLVPLINKALKLSKISYYDLNYVALTQGPGSFTGIRVGISAASAICSIVNATPIVFTTFELYKRKVYKKIKADFLCVILRAYGSEYYVQTFDLKSDLKYDYFLYSFDQLSNYLNQFESQSIVTTGSVIEDKNLMNFFVQKHIMFLPTFICAKTLIGLAIYSIKKGEFNSLLQPLYIKEASVNIINKK